MYYFGFNFVGICRVNAEIGCGEPVCRVLFIGNYILWRV